jgi:hypothetical protein
MESFDMIPCKLLLPKTQMLSTFSLPLIFNRLAW